MSVYVCVCVCVVDWHGDAMVFTPPPTPQDPQTPAAQCLQEEAHKTAESKSTRDSREQVWSVGKALDSERPGQAENKPRDTQTSLIPTPHIRANALGLKGSCS